MSLDQPKQSVPDKKDCTHSYCLSSPTVGEAKKIPLEKGDTTTISVKQSLILVKVIKKKLVTGTRIISVLKII